MTEKRKRGKKHNVKNDEYEIMDRRRMVAELYVRGSTQWEIAHVVGVDQATISLDLKFIRQLWMDQMVGLFDQFKADQLLKIDKVEIEAWKAWDRSCADAEEVTMRRKTVRKNIFEEESNGSKSSNGNGRSSKSKTKKKPIGHEMIPVEEENKVVRRGQCGDSSYLDKILKCAEMRLKILGILDDKNTVNVNQNNLTVNWDKMYEKQTLLAAIQNNSIEQRIAAVAELEAPS